MKDSLINYKGRKIGRKRQWTPSSPGLSAYIARNSEIHSMKNSGNASKLELKTNTMTPTLFTVSGHVEAMDAASLPHYYVAQDA